MRSQQKESSEAKSEMINENILMEKESDLWYWMIVGGLFGLGCTLFFRPKKNNKLGKYIKDYVKDKSRIIKEKINLTDFINNL